MKQDIAKTMTGIAASATTAGAGLAAHEVSLGIKYCTAAILNASRTAAFTAALLYSNTKLLLRTKRDTLDAARINARAFATLLRDVLKPVFGSEFNDNWLALGFKDSLAIPTQFDDLLELLEKMAAFLAANPTREVATLNITATYATTVTEAFADAATAVTLQESALGTIMADRDAKYVTLRGKLVQLVDELSHLIDPLDPRWTAFGFNKPGAQETPDVPVNVSAVLIGPNAAAVKWDASARAEYYRVWKKVVGLDTELVAAGSPADIDFALENLPANATIEIYVSAVNNGGESQVSEKMVITTH